MLNPYLEKFAELLVKYSVNVQKGEKVKIYGNIVTEPLLKEIYKQVTKVGGLGLVRPKFDDFDYIFYQNASKEQIEYLHDIIVEEIKYFDVNIYIGGARNLKANSNINPELLAITSKMQRPLYEIVYDKESKGKYKWTYAVFPTFANAQEANMSIDFYADYILKTCKVYKDNPIQEWENFSKMQDKIVQRLNGSKKVKVIGKDTDIELSVEGRKWVNCDGKQNMPDGEIFTCPVENSVNGKIRYTFPAIYAGNEVEDITLEFKNGKVINAKAKKGEDFLNKMIAADEGACILGEFAIGTNEEADKFVKDMLFDEKMKGTIHLALGFNPDPKTGGQNKSSIHWDMLKDMKDGGEIYIDDKLFYKNGDFVEKY